MLLTRKITAQSGETGPSRLVANLARSMDAQNRRAVPVMDRRAFLRRSGMGVGAGIAASQLTLVTSN